MRFEPYLRVRRQVSSDDCITPFEIEVGDLWEYTKVKNFQQMPIEI